MPFINIALSRSGVKEALSELLVFENIPKRELWEKLLPPFQEEEFHYLPKAIILTTDHQSETSTDIRWFILFISLSAEILVLQTREQVEQIVYFPTRGDMHMVRPFIRSTEGCISGMKEIDAPWVEDFWTELWLKSDCELGVIDYSNDVNYSINSQEIKKLQINLMTHFINTVQTTGIDEKHDLLIGSGLYSLNLISELVDHDIKLTISGRLILRTLVELFITIKYLIVKNDNELWVPLKTTRKVC